MMKAKKRTRHPLSGLFVLVLVIALMPLAGTQRVTALTTAVFINEIHYDNDGTDAGEAIEVAGPAGTDLAGWSLVLYNGNGGTLYSTTPLSGLIPDQQAGYGTAYWAISGIQNGSPDGMALVNPSSVVVQFLSYEGTFAAVDGPAAGMTSVDIGVSEPSNTPLGYSLQLSGTGTVYEDFTWNPPAGNTFGAVNTGQTFSGGGLDYTPIYDIQYTTDPGGASPYVGLEVTTEGIVTAVFANGYFIEDPAGGPWNGLWVYDYSGPALGDRLRLTGTVAEYYGLTELATLTFYDVESSGNPLPDPLVVTTGAANDEQYEGVLIRVENVTVTAEEDPYGEWQVDDGSGPLVVDNLGTDTYVPVLGDLLAAVIGPLNYSYGAFKIAPRDDNDIIQEAPGPDVIINELDSDTPGTDALEFVELYDGGLGNTALDGLVVVFYNGSSDLSYYAADLDTYSTDANGYFVLGNAGVSGVDLVFSGNLLQNGQDAAALYVGDAADFPNNTPVTTANLVDAIVYDTDDADDPGLLVLLNPGEPQVNENSQGASATDSNQRCPNGSGGARNTSSYVQAPPTSDNPNDCYVPPPEQCGDPYTFIYQIQGDGLESPLVGQEVSLEGIVVGDYQNNGQPDDGDLNGFHVQDLTGDGNAVTSDGIFIYAPGAADVSAGDGVRVRGVVSEYDGVTEVTVDQLWLCSTGNNVAPTSLSLPVASVDDFEPYEGMLVTFPQTLYLSEYYNFDRYNEIVLTTERQNTPTAVFEPGSPERAALADLNLRSRITLDDGRAAQNPDPALHPAGYIFDMEHLFRGGDTVANVTGVMDYARELYRIQPVQGADYTPANFRTAEPDDVGGSLKVASFNLLNYFTTIDTGVPICGPNGDLECRGADSEEEFIRQRDKIIPALAIIDADVVGLVEIENYPGDVPTADLVSGLNDMMGAGMYDYVATGAIGTDAIRVALIYKPATVTPLGAYAILDSSVDPRFLDTKNRPVLAQSFQDNVTGGIFTVAVNHLKSKGSDCNDVGDPDLGDGAGNCNLTRKHAAEALVDWLASDPTGSGDADALIVGDLNSYDKEDPIDVLLAGGYTDLVAEHHGEYAYSYVFDGQLGYLDYSMPNADLLDEVTGATVWHINADEPDLINYDMDYKLDPQDALYAPDAYRSSDHDPVIAGLSVCDEIPPTLEVSVSPNMLWPPDHKYVTVAATVQVSDNWDPSPTVTLVSVTSNEPDDGLGDGDKPDDIVIVDDYTFKLRAERSGTGEGRVYTITYEATDACGNSTLASATVIVPRDRRK